MAQRPSEVMTSEEVAELLQLSIRTIKRLMDDGHLPFSKIGHSVRFSRRKLMEIIENGTNTTWKRSTARRCESLSYAI